MKYPRLPFKLNRSKKLSDEQIESIIKLHARGVGVVELARKFKVHRHTILYHISPAYRKKLITLVSQMKKLKVETDELFQISERKRQRVGKKRARALLPKEHKAYRRSLK